MDDIKRPGSNSDVYDTREVETVPHEDESLKTNDGPRRGDPSRLEVSGSRRWGRLSLDDGWFREVEA